MVRFKLLYVYILKCSDNTYYTGVTNDPERRLSEHQTGKNKKAYTFNKRPVQMMYCEGFNDFRYAIDWEKRIKNWSQKKKEALIAERFDLLPDLSKKNFVKKSLLDTPEKGYSK